MSSRPATCLSPPPLFTTSRARHQSVGFSSGSFWASLCRPWMMASWYTSTMTMTTDMRVRRRSRSMRCLRKSSENWPSSYFRSTWWLKSISRSTHLWQEGWRREWSESIRPRSPMSLRSRHPMMTSDVNRPSMLAIDRTCAREIFKKWSCWDAGRLGK